MNALHFVATCWHYTGYGGPIGPTWPTSTWE